MSEDMELEYPIWRIWLDRPGADLNEIRWRWTYVDVLKANALLDMQDAYKMAVEGLPDGSA